jgi:uncharacterized coiled-coil protein SlyX
MASIIVTAAVAMLCGEPKVNLHTLSCEALRIVAQEYLDQKDVAVAALDAEKARIEKLELQTAEMEETIKTLKKSLRDTRRDYDALDEANRKLRNELEAARKPPSQREKDAAAEKGEFAIGMSFDDCLAIMRAKQDYWHGPQVVHADGVSFTVVWTEIDITPAEIRAGAFDRSRVASTRVVTFRANRVIDWYEKSGYRDPIP